MGSFRTFLIFAVSFQQPRMLKMAGCRANFSSGNNIIYKNLVNIIRIKSVWSSFTKIITKHKYTDTPTHCLD